MKETYLVISDIHGALSGAEAMEKAYEIHKPDQILCLGDILYHGPRNDLPEDYNPKAVIEIMNKYAGEDHRRERQLRSGGGPDGAGLPLHVRLQRIPF